jgi:PIN domain nuclease of toxin-antitoxin system
MGGRATLSALLLDTHAWVWWISRPERLSRRQRGSIERTLRRADAALLVSIISCWEVALLAQHGRFRFTIPTETWLEQATALPGIQLVPLSLPIIVTAARFAALRDPADMLIVATAQHHGARLVTSDTRIAETDLIPIVA